jgi:hypothetical protein
MDGEYSLGIVEDSLSQRGLARVNMSTNTNVSQFLNIIHNKKTSKRRHLESWSFGVWE